MSAVPPYTKVIRFGDRKVQDILRDKIVVQEKFDGSQLSWMKDYDGTLRIRSKNQEIDQSSPGNFDKAVEHLRAHQDAMMPGTVYRGEYLRGSRQNVIQYDRVPRGHIVLYDVQSERYMGPSRLKAEADALGLDYAETLYEGRGARFTEEMLEAELSKPSMLGGMREGVVIKSLDRIGGWVADRGRTVWASDVGGLPLMAKVVSEQFKEVRKRPRVRGDQGVSFAEQLGEQYATKARWAKAVQRLRETGRLTNSPRDIEPIKGEVVRDMLEEEGELIASKLLKAYKKQLAKGATSGLAEWYLGLLEEDR